MENTSVAEKRDIREGVTQAPSGPSGGLVDGAEAMINEGAHDVAQAGSALGSAIKTAGIDVGKELEHAGAVVADASIAAATDIVAAGRQLGHDAARAVTAPAKPLEPSDEPVVAAAIAQVP
ncbi:MAG TPA: hypothetical protein VN842_05305 [Thermoplasmata archaeon]|nr:hypothetical protein [Thermoplasmata archaeon]